MSGGALVVLSGGLDSTVCMSLAAIDTGSAPVAVTFDYGQRTRVEISRATRIAEAFGAPHLVVNIDTRPWGGSALVDTSIDVPATNLDAVAGECECEGEGEGEGEGKGGDEIPVTYVPARNIIFLSVALGIAEARDLDSIYIGVNSLDYSGYPDCRPEFIAAFQGVADVGQKRSLMGNPIQIMTPLISLSKAEIVELGLKHGTPLELTWSCYLNGDKPCTQCESCQLRAKGFAQAGCADPGLAN